MKAIIIGSGVGGLATAIRLAKLGLTVDVFESNPFPGGKVNSILVGDFRYDMGPSVCTEPHLVDELVALCGKEKSFFQYSHLKESFRYFFQDGQKLSLHPGGENAASLFEKELGENKETVENYLANQEKNYKAVYPVFIEVSLHRIKHWLNESFWKAISRLFKYGIAKSMHKVNVKTFKNPKTVKIFDRFATYNGSSPYKTPGMLNIISHLELNVGPVMPKGGMVAISNT
ncbi:MAG: FAD-binding protein, partial [Crocinitomicaceae bacterium]|nr:FAD-binding protein [Crocinitomicaceae bacterium]